MEPNKKAKKKWQKPTLTIMSANDVNSGTHAGFNEKQIFTFNNKSTSGDTFRTFGITGAPGFHTLKNNGPAKNYYDS